MVHLKKVLCCGGLACVIPSSMSQVWWKLASPSSIGQGQIHIQGILYRLLLGINFTSQTIQSFGVASSLMEIKQLLLDTRR
jgi:hypothetical protein